MSLIWENLIVDLTSLFGATTAFDRRDLRRLTANYAWFNSRLTVKIFHGSFLSLYVGLFAFVSSVNLQN